MMVTKDVAVLYTNVPHVLETILFVLQEEGALPGRQIDLITQSIEFSLENILFSVLLLKSTNKRHSDGHEIRPEQCKCVYITRKNIINQDHLFRKIYRHSIYYMEMAPIRTDCLCMFYE